MVVADFGCGTGYYSIASAKIVGKNGKVYAIDVQKDLLQAVKSSALISDLKNIEIVWADLELLNGSRLANESVDLIIISNILFQSENHSAISKEALRILKKGGRVAVVEWIKSPDANGKIGPSEEKRLSKEETQKIFFEEGFKLEKDFEAGDNHYGLLFTRP